MFAVTSSTALAASRWADTVPSLSPNTDVQLSTKAAQCRLAVPRPLGRPLALLLASAGHRVAIC